MDAVHEWFSLVQVARGQAQEPWRRAVGVAVVRPDARLRPPPRGTAGMQLQGQSAFQSWPNGILTAFPPCFILDTPGLHKKA